MNLAEIRDIIATSAKDVKERACRKRPTDISHTIDIYRGDHPVATVVLKGDGSDFLEAYRLAVIGFDADQVATMIESYTTGPNFPEVGTNPITGEEMDNSTLSDLFYNHDGAIKGWVLECLFIQVRNRAGDMIAARLPYHYVGGKHLVWDERENLPEDLAAKYPDDDPDDWHEEGRMADPMNYFMAEAPTFSQLFPGIIIEEATRAQMDVAVTETIQRRVKCTIMLWALEGGERERVIHETMRRAN